MLDITTATGQNDKCLENFASNKYKARFLIGRLYKDDSFAFQNIGSAPNVYNDDNPVNLSDLSPKEIN